MEVNMNDARRGQDEMLPELSSSEERSAVETLNRWRLILGESAEEGLCESDQYKTGEFQYVELDEILGYLYNREYGEEQGYRKRVDVVHPSLPYLIGYTRSEIFFPNQRLKFWRSRHLIVMD